MKHIEKVTREIPTTHKIEEFRCVVCGHTERADAFGSTLFIDCHYRARHMAKQVVGTAHDDRTREVYFVRDDEEFQMLLRAEKHSAHCHRQTPSSVKFAGEGWYVVMVEQSDYEEHEQTVTICRADEWAKGLEETVAHLINDIRTIRRMIKERP